MTSEVFATWFTLFSEHVSERPLLIILDGHTTQLSFQVMEQAIDEDVTILKLPPHVTGVLQPLDVCCFGPLKRLWEKTLNAWVNEYGPRETMKKRIFVNKICEVCHKK